MLVVLALCWFAGAVAVPVWRVRRATAELHDFYVKTGTFGGFMTFQDEKADLAARVAEMGGPERALPRLRRYVALSGWAAPRRQLAIGLMGACGEPAARDLVQLLGDRDPLVRRSAARALCMVGPEAREVIPELVEALETPDQTVQCFAANTLYQIGPAAKAAVPALVRLLKDYRSSWEAEKALTQILGSDFGEVRSALRVCRSSYSSKDASGALRMLSEKTEAVRKLKAYLDVPGIDRRDRHLCVMLLESCGREAYPLLLRLLDDPDDGMRMWSAYALGYLGVEAKGAIEKLRVVVRGKGKDSLHAAIYALGQMGRAAIAAVPDLEALEKHKDPEIREVAQSSLILIRGFKVRTARWGGPPSAKIPPSSSQTESPPDASVKGATQ